MASAHLMVLVLLVLSSLLHLSDSMDRRQPRAGSSSSSRSSSRSRGQAQGVDRRRQPQVVDNRRRFQAEGRGGGRQPQVVDHRRRFQPNGGGQPQAANHGVQPWQADLGGQHDSGYSSMSDGPGNFDRNDPMRRAMRRGRGGQGGRGGRGG